MPLVEPVAKDGFVNFSPDENIFCQEGNEDSDGGT